MFEPHDDDLAHDPDSSRDDLTAEFWGRGRGWTSSGEQPVTRQRRDRTGGVPRVRTHQTGPIERTRSHRAVAAPTSGPDVNIQPFDDGLDGIDIGDRADRPDWNVHRGGADAGRAHEIDLVAGDDRRPTMLAAAAERVGLGHVDPFLIRLGVIVAVGILLIPLALGLRGDTDDGTLEIVPDRAAALDATADALDAPEAAATLAPTGGSQLAAATASPQPTATAPATAAEPAATTMAEDVEPRVATAAAKTPSTEPPATTSVATPPATAVSEVADVDAPAERLEPVCAATYTVEGGDYWVRLASSSGVSLGELLEANLATPDTPIFPGDEICLPEGARMPSPPTTEATETPTTDAPTTTAPATTAPSTTAAPSTTIAPAPAGHDEVVAIIRDVWPDELEEKAFQIVERESKFQPDAYNGWCCYGLFQIYFDVHQSWLDDVGVTSASQLFDARTNAEVAYMIYQRSGGWGPWGG